MVLLKVNALYEDFVQELAEVQQEKGEGAIASLAFLQLSRLYLDKLRTLVLEAGFENEEEELQFFKSLKPKFLCLQLFYTLQGDLIGASPSSKKLLKKFYALELVKIANFRTANRNLLQYLNSDEHCLDNRLFLRKVDQQPHWLIKIGIDRDENFSSPADYLIAKLLAFDKLEHFILEELIKMEALGQNVKSTELPKEYRWTGEAINLVELAYGLYYTGEINNGHAGIAEIVRLLEKIFNITIGKPSRRFAEIKQRRRLSKTKYLDQMKTAIDKRIDEDDKFVPKPNFR